MGLYDQSIEDYSKAVYLRPDDADIYFNRGRSYDLTDQYHKAIHDFDRVIELNPDYPAVFYYKGNLCRRAKRYSEAIDAFQIFLKRAGPEDEDLIRAAQKEMQMIRER